MVHESRPSGQFALRMSGSEVILVAVTSALVAVFTMLIIATIRRARARDDDEES